MISMLGVGIEADLSCREKYALTEKRQQEILQQATALGGEMVIINTCNRTEIFFSGIDQDAVYALCGWKKSDDLHVLADQAAVRHLFELSCGFLSAVPGEDQILYQLRQSLQLAEKKLSCGRSLSRLFQQALNCGRQFRKAIINRLQPYSLLSIVKQLALEKKCRTFTIAGYGNFGKLACEYLLTADIDQIYILSRTLKKSPHSKIQIVNYDAKRDVLAQSDCLISVTSAPHQLFKSEDFSKSLLAFDLAVPRDIAQEVQSKGVTLYDVDSLIGLQKEYLTQRLTIMHQYSEIMEKFITDFMIWQSEEEIKPFIYSLKQRGVALYEQKKSYYQRKMDFQDQHQLTDGLLKSTSETFIKRAVEVLKDEHQAGRGKECQQLLNKIFQI